MTLLFSHSCCSPSRHCYLLRGPWAIQETTPYPAPVTCSWFQTPRMEKQGRGWASPLYKHSFLLNIWALIRNLDLVPFFSRPSSSLSFSSSLPSRWTPVHVSRRSAHNNCGSWSGTVSDLIGYALFDEFHLYAFLLAPILSCIPQEVNY